MTYRLGVDLGGTKIEAALLESMTLSVVDRMRIPTEASRGYEHICNNLVGIINEITRKNNIVISRVGICTPGTLDPITNTMKNCNTTSLNGMPLKDDLELLLGMEVLLSNDANCFAVAEANLGIAKDVLPNAEVVFGVIMGTGVGGGLVVNGRVIGGRQGIGGEWGHNVLEENGGLCYCGKSGCVETVISGPALEKYYAHLSGKFLPMQEIVNLYRTQDDVLASQTMDRLFENFGKAIAVVINILDPDVVVIGGGLGNIEELYTLGVKQVKQHIFNDRLDTFFLKPKLGDSAGVYGAALL